MIGGGSDGVIAFEAGGAVFVLRVVFDAVAGVVRTHVQAIPTDSALCAVARQQWRRPRPRRQRACPK